MWAWKKELTSQKVYLKSRNAIVTIRSAVVVFFNITTQSTIKYESATLLMKFEKKTFPFTALFLDQDTNAKNSKTLS